MDLLIYLKKFSLSTHSNPLERGADFPRKKKRAA